MKLSNPLNRDVVSNPPNILIADVAPSAPQGQRFLWVDAIRGLACVAVIMRHLYHPASGHPGLAALFPAWLGWLHVVSAAGVYAFFVISGFVIAHSLRNNSLSNAAVVNFIVRRQVRLDPVYWVCIALFCISFLVLGESARSFPNILINAFYLQSLLGKPSVIGPAWTLCIEIQFYLIFIGLLIIGKKSKRINENNNLTIVTLVLLFATGIFALVVKHFIFKGALFIFYWHYFVVGALSYYAMQSLLSLRWYGLFLGIFFVSLCFSPLAAIQDFGTGHSRSMAAMIVAFSTALSLYYAGTQGKMATWGNTPILQYLGRISYTLYLIHTLVIELLVHFVAPQPIESKLAALGFYILCVVVSIGFAHILHLLVEKPSMKFSSQLKMARA